MAVTNTSVSGATYVQIAQNTLTSTTSAITFNNIPQNFTDLRIVVFGNQYTSASYGDFNLRYNSDSGSNYSQHYFFSNTTQGSTPQGNAYNSNSTSISLQKMVDLTPNTLTYVSHSTYDIFSYSNTNFYKTGLLSNSMINSTEYSYVSKGVSTWRSTAAITSLSILAITDPPFNVGTTVYIYGIKGA